jgi:3-hydroxyisobutyrate dehydrogenase
MTAVQTEKQTNRRRPTETIAVLGAGGTMGFPIARNIVRAGLPTRVWNRSSEKARPLTTDGAYLARTPEDAASGAGIVITMLADEEAVIRAMDGPDGALRAMRSANQPSTSEHADNDQRGPRHALWVQMSTIGEAATERCAELASRNGVGFVDAPVLGTRQPAEEGRLVILESGPQEARQRLAPVFDAIGRSTIRAGEAGAGSRLKLVVDWWVLAVLESAAETISLAEAFDLDPALVLGPAGDAEDGPEPGPEPGPGPGPGRDAEERRLDLPLIEALARRFAEAAAKLPACAPAGRDLSS